MAKVFQKRPDIVRMLNEGASASKIAAAVGCSVPMIYKVGREIGHQFNGAGLEDERRREIMLALQRNEPIKRIAKEYHTSAETVRRVRDMAGIESGAGVNQYGGYDERLERAKRVISERAPGFEYVGGFTDTDSGVQIRCCTCGDIKTVNMGSVRHGKVGCSVCRQRKMQVHAMECEQERQRKQQAAEEKRKADMLEKIAGRTQIGFRFCGCGAVLPVDSHAKYCLECRRRIDNKKREVSRRIKIKQARVDTDITVKRLFLRDRGVCWICGKICDLHDWAEVNGTIICGNEYPSIDHVIPLSKGGKDSWDNVRLAHRICNSIKSDKIYPARVCL